MRNDIKSSVRSSDVKSAQSRVEDIKEYSAREPSDMGIEVQEGGIGTFVLDRTVKSGLGFISPERRWRERGGGTRIKTTVRRHDCKRPFSLWKEGILGDGGKEKDPLGWIGKGPDFALRRELGRKSVRRKT